MTISFGCILYCGCFNLFCNVWVLVISVVVFTVFCIFVPCFFLYCLVCTWGADKSLARPGRKQANVSVRMA